MFKRRLAGSVMGSNCGLISLLKSFITYVLKLKAQLGITVCSLVMIPFSCDLKKIN